MKDSFVRRGAHWIVISLFLAIAGCGGDSGTGDDGDNGNGGGDPTQVTIRDNSFNPTSNTVSPGATVTWTWTNTNNTHNVTFADASIADSNTKSSGTHVATMPTTPAAYTYQCTIHPDQMNGTVTVQ